MKRHAVSRVKGPITRHPQPVGGSTDPPGSQPGTELSRPFASLFAPAILGDVLAILLLLTICLFLGLARYSSGLDLADEGCLAYGAVEVLEGKVPNRDFVTLQPPLSFYVAAAVFKLLGTSLLSLRILGLVIYLLVPLLIYRIARSLLGPVLSLAAAVPAIFLGMPFFHFVPLPIWQGITASLLAGLLFLRATERDSRFAAFLAGIVTAVSMMLRHDQGLYLALSIFTYTLACHFAKTESAPKLRLKLLLGWWGTGMASVGLPAVACWAVAGALPEMVRQLVLFPLSTYAKTSSRPFPALHAGLTSSPDIILVLYYFAPALLLAAGIWLCRRLLRHAFTLRDARLAFVLVWSALFYCQVLVRSDLYHLLYTLPPFFVLCACCWKGACDALERTVVKLVHAPAPARWTIGVVSFVAVACLAWFLAAIQPVVLAPPIPAAETVALSRARIRKTGGQNLQKFVERVQQLAPPGQPILSLPYAPMFYFLCERENPTRWNYLWPGDQTPQEHAALVQQARNARPALVLIMGETEMSTYAAPVLAYVHAEYKLVTSVGGTFNLYLPKEPGGNPGLTP